jgi:tape measure domain-containing protein
VAYRADIEIAVRGATQITNLQQQINTLAKGINVLNKTLRSGTVASIDNFNKAVAQSDRVMRAAAQGTRVQKQAIDTYVRSTIAAEKAERSLQVAIERRRKELGLAAATPTGGGSRRGTGGRLGGAISGAVIGGSFPLLFGQGGGAAAGGAIGGLAGGLLGPGGSFAGSLLGTLLGDIASKGQQIKELGTDIGFSAEQTKELQSAFKLAGQEAEKFNDAVQNIRGLSLSIEEQANAIRLVSQLTETYGGRIDKTTNAFTSALESGKVTQATLNQLTSQGIPIQDELAKKYGVSRDAILAMAKDGQVSVQTLADVLVDMGNKGIQAGEKPKTAFEQFTIALGNTVTAVTNVANALLTVLAPAIDAIIQKATLALNALTETINTELLRTQIQGQTGKVISPETMQRIEKDAMDMAARRYPSEAKGRQLAAGSGVISPRAQQEFQILREQGIRNELQRFGYEQGILKAPKSAVSAEIGRITAPGQLPPSGGGGGKGAADKAARLEEQTQQRLRALTRENELIAQIAGLRQLQFQAELANDKELQARLKGEEQIVSIIQRTSQELDGITDARLQQAILTKAETEITAARQQTTLDLIKIEHDRTKALEELLEGYDLELLKLQAKTDVQRAAVELLELENRLKQQGITLTDVERETIRRKIAERQIALNLLTEEEFRQQQINQSINDMGAVGMSVIDNLINRTQSWNDILRSTLKSVGSILMKLGLNMLAGSDGVGFFSILAGSFTGGTRANGGPVSGGAPYLVGERGPELFVPGNNGGVMSNSDLRNAMGSAPGSGGGGPVLNMSFETTTIGGVEYVSRDQLEQAMAETRRAASRDGAQRGMSMTLDKLQQSPATRSRVGLR